jgi:hypothetical protein
MSIVQGQEIKASDLAGGKIGNGLTGVSLKRPPLAAFTLTQNGNTASLGWPTGETSDATSDSLVLTVECVPSSGGGGNDVYALAAVPAGQSIVSIGYEFDATPLFNMNGFVLMQDGNGLFHKFGFTNLFATLSSANLGTVNVPLGTIAFGSYTSLSPDVAGTSPAPVSFSYAQLGRGYFILDSSAGLANTILKFCSNGREAEAIAIAEYPLTAAIVSAGFGLFPGLNTAAEPSTIDALAAAGKLFVSCRLIHMPLNGE